MKKSAESRMNTPLYERDYYAWVQSQVEALRLRKTEQIDFENLLDEVDDLGKSERRELMSRLGVLLLHLLKWQFQTDRRGSSWEATIRVQRMDIARLLAENPSLKSLPNEELDFLYKRTLIQAASETGLSADAFPQTAPYSADQILDEAFWPEAA